jgi:hypothetical protein
MASTCVWFPYPDSACLVLGCVRVCVVPQRLSKGKCIGSHETGHSALECTSELTGHRLRGWNFYNPRGVPGGWATNEGGSPGGSPVSATPTRGHPGTVPPPGKFLRNSPVRGSFFGPPMRGGSRGVSFWGHQPPMRGGVQGGVARLAPPPFAVPTGNFTPSLSQNPALEDCHVVRDS